MGLISSFSSCSLYNALKRSIFFSFFTASRFCSSIIILGKSIILNLPIFLSSLLPRFKTSMIYCFTTRWIWRITVSPRSIVSLEFVVSMPSYKQMDSIWHRCGNPISFTTFGTTLGSMPVIATLAGLIHLIEE